VFFASIVEGRTRTEVESPVHDWLICSFSSMSSCIWLFCSALFPLDAILAS
jgi:hypothetical protein